ncbi:hypothetical protein [Streptomyces sp. NPDC005209]|uniref:hypothetical protein n=1 Tax=Streptomyces sp. NPDC005209 TaxID=3156715 RepID=UPI00339E0640
MSVSALEIPAEVLEALTLPDLGTLEDARRRGAKCIWGGERLTAETAIGLGEHQIPRTGTTAFPRACRTCAAKRAYHALLDHGTDCRLCATKATAAQCAVGRGLHRIVREGWR